MDSSGELRDNPSRPEAYKEAPTSPIHERHLDAGAYQADLQVDFANQDQTGLIWAWLDHAPDPSVVLPDAVLILRDGEDIAMGQVVDLINQDRGTLVHLRLLPGAVEDYHGTFKRAAPRSL